MVDCPNVETLTPQTRRVNSRLFCWLTIILFALFSLKNVREKEKERERKREVLLPFSIVINGTFSPQFLHTLSLIYVWILHCEDHESASYHFPGGKIWKSLAYGTLLFDHACYTLLICYSITAVLFISWYTFNFD